MSLRSRIVLAVLAVFALISGAAGYLMLTRAEVGLQRAFDRATQTRAAWLLALVSVDPVVIPLPTETERMRVVYRSYGQRRELFRSPGFPDETAPPSNRTSHRSITVEGTPVQTPDGQLILTLAVPDESLRQDIGRLRWVFGLSWVLSLILAFGAGYGVAGWLLRPIQRIVNQVDAINNTSAIDPIELPKTRDELYHLTATLNRMLARIRESVEGQRHFFGAAAHELRTPLTVMKTGLQVTLKQSPPDAATTAFLSGQLEEVSRLTRLINEFLTLSQPDTIAPVLKLSAVDLPELLDNCLRQLASLTADYGVTTVFDRNGFSDAILQTDALKLEHILLNLIENAVKYAVSDSVVTIRLQNSGQWQVRIENRTIRESGPTLDLRQAYYRADPFKEGHGLGLWITHRLTTLLGGTLQLDWKSHTFTSELSLPVSNPDSSTINP
ncbi:sensor histidine kinase [Larkinella humicola]|uniref:histidine kinase n=1 Tax=Larkinella humicola TaxID=2607654 RepID=A0A5N1JLW0_9BACT|nr:HAMP domain-containing sensor histidine kinase [Larkinella humicola]KAA9356437.1 HAMP domain-containing histidine kinase [Larkinella humicola]